MNSTMCVAIINQIVSFLRLSGANQEAPNPDTGQTVEERCNRYFQAHSRLHGRSNYQRKVSR